VLAAIPPLRTVIRVGVQGPEPADGVREPLRRVLTTLHLHRQHVDRQDIGPEEGDEARARRILVTSAQGGEGKSVVAANLALVARELGAEVALIDADLDGSALSRLLGVGAVPGLSDVGAGRVPIEEAWQRVENLEKEPVTIGPDGSALASVAPSASEVMVLTSGSRDRTSAGTVGDSVPPVLDWSGRRFDYVIVDCPPPLAVSDVLPLLSEVDAVVVVSRWGETKVATAERLVELLERLPRVPFLGVIANDVPDDERNAFGFVSVRRS
jgi:Mrp family chromosome partitioning ATPase